VRAPDKSWDWNGRLTTEDHESGIRLLPPGALIKTGPVDHADWNFKPILGWIQQQRFRLALSLLPKDRIGRILEIGYGSGVFLPELSRHCEELHGIDLHGRNEEIAGELVKQGVSAQLRSGTAEVLPFDSESFDLAVAVSSLEFVADVSAACREIARVLKPNGSLILVTPGHSPVVDLGLRLLTGESAKKDYGKRRQSLMTLVAEHFRVKERRLFPPVAGPVVCLYRGFRMQPAHITQG
jgi:ubiquinone/menaquinone biosynthesis C-methylase UbiE